MEAEPFVRRHFRMAFLTSTGIGIITMGPVFVVGTAFVNIKPEFLIRLGLVCLISVSFLVFLFWTINIMLDKWLNKLKILSGKVVARSLLSIVFCLLLFHGFRVLAVSILINSPYTLEIVKWKGEFFGIGDQALKFLEYTQGTFPMLMITLIVISVNSVVIIIYRLILLNETKVRVESENLALTIKNMEASNQALRQQLQPHFLFNSLSTLKSLIRKQPVMAEEYLMKLSEFLRVSVSLNAQSTVKLSDEISFCKGYLEMQKIRFGEALLYSVHISGELMDAMVPVFSVQLLVENAIKHNNFTFQSPLSIRVFSQDNNIVIANNYQPKPVSESSTGLGLSNLEERYRLLGCEGIDIRNDDGVFSVTIKALMNENSNNRG